MPGFTHLDESGSVRMVDVTGKPGTVRSATASGYIRMQPATVQMLASGDMPKGNVLTTAHIAGVQAAKQTAHLIPMCHQLNLSWVDVSFEVDPDRIVITSVSRTRESTGVEMEALTAVSVAALTIYDMCKAVDKTMEIGGIRLVSKTGGRTSSAVSCLPRAAVLVMSDACSRGEREDRSGEILRAGLEKAGCRDVVLRIVADEPAEITAALQELTDQGAELVLTSGGTGLGPRDVTIDTLQPLFTRRLPGIEQALLQWGQSKLRTAMLSRLAAGMIGDVMVICLPGSSGAASDALEVLVPPVFHAFSMLRGEGH
ncbi:bifunctional molybdenum cofactor biosynthesis protein MoaC/MoaB [Prosthecochloris sp. HL-130-GSB]|jgi:cyclic pyranopterin monophosphate synthase|uniref:bifunctional molybdenum cofactor biosynthesis protein MoaC/MoaB n=1 Tax=Prosthecochloris sp. HL-130-GSB TaxID=1974213 RepID=UPI000A1C101E|nr:bifunctional molybdenum cofactor biosynthesis protein MoaC/MoaB [Prosthecochloris sp. HL-130-GSB]ARM31645.1 bifunctional molybdenum cofactor biosynthesis protein MoaC/MoaB [Prosthecochloris sp. HL-130-GSB]